MLDQNYYSEDSMNTHCYVNTEDYDTLEYTHSSVQTQAQPRPKETKPYTVNAVFERVVCYRGHGNTHVQVLCRYETEDDVKRDIMGMQRCALRIMNNLPNKRDVLFIAHTSNCDARFLMKLNRTMSPPIDNNNNNIYVKGELHRYNNPRQSTTFAVTHSYMLIPMAISEFGECFKLDIKQGLMIYTLYTEHILNSAFFLSPMPFMSLPSPIN